MGIKLYNHQQSAVDRFKEKSQILAHEMGLGKTITSVMIGQGERSLIVCPAKLKKSWVAELKKVGEEDVQIIQTGKDEIEDTAWVIVSYDIAMRIYDRLLAEKFNHMFVDESHYIKGKCTIRKDGTIIGTKRAGAVLLLAEAIPHKILTTGTPVMNKPIELWNQLVAVDAQITKDMARSSFSKIYCGGHLKQMGYLRFWWENGANRLDELKEKIAGDMDIVRKLEVLDLPDKVVNRRVIEFTPAEQKEYDQEWDRYVAWIEANPDYSEKDIQNVVNAKQLVEMQKLQQITSRAKVNAVIEDLENLAPDEQVVIFAKFVKTVETLNEAIKDKARKQKKAGEAHIITYSTLKQENSVEDFQQKRVQVLTSNIIAGGTGLNLQNANQVWIIDEDWVPAINTQAEDRIYRIGQEQTAFITYYEVFGTVDEDVRDTVASKKKVISKIMD